MKRSSSTQPLWPSPSSIPGISDHQRETLEKSFQSRIGILSGTPGTGKTYTAAAAIKSILSAHGSGQTAICAPTGKAAVRCTASLQSNGVELEATTIHRLLGVSRNGYDGKGWGFIHNEFDRLPYKFYLLDESSMLDTDTGAAFFRALPDDAHLLLIGDPFQLPPVSHGAVLRDLISANIPTGELSEIRRNSGDIVHVCKEVKDGMPFRSSPTVNIANGHNLLHIESKNSSQTIRTLTQRLLSAKSNPSLGIDPIWDCQVIVAVNEKSDLSRKNVNRGLQKLLNPNGITAGKHGFRVGDKVICLSNSIMFTLDESGEKIPLGMSDFLDDSNEKYETDFVANGEIGRVVRVFADSFHVAFEIPRRCVEVSAKGGADSTSFDLAYAISCHKSQGSSARIIIVLIDDYPGANFICSREWHYTAISRAEELCITIGRMETINRQCRSVSLGLRKTFLKERIIENIENIEKFIKGAA